MAASKPGQTRNDTVELPVAGPPAWFEWEGVRWYRRTGRNGLQTAGHYADRTGGLLHVAIWERVTRKRLPGDHVVHHKDHDPGNNDPGNLVAITREEHLREHGLLGRPHSREVREVISTAQKAAWANREPHPVTCAWCNEEFWSTGQRAKFCSDAHREAHYRSERRKRWAG